MSSPIHPGVPSVLLLAVLPACASYNQRIDGPLKHFEAGRFEEARAGFADTGRTGSAFLSGVEAGTAALVGGDFEAARDRFTDALAAVKDIEERAVVGVESLAEVLTDWAVNEGSSAYAGEGYERVMAHSCLGLAYLALGQADSVLVEARRVDELLTKEQELYDAQYGAGGLGHFLSALAYELLDKPGEAYIDYQRLQEKGLGGELTGRALVRLSGLLGRRERDDWVQQYGAGEEVPMGAASIVLVGGTGLGPAKREVKIDVPLPDGVFSWAVPQFEAGEGAAPLELRFPDSGTTLRASVLEDVSHVARENLDDRIAFLAGRSAVRGLLKRQLAEQLRDNGKHGAWMGLAVDIFSIATERADLRAWRTLPENWQAARAFVAPDLPQRVVVAVQGGDSVDLGTFRLSPGEPMFVLARSIQGRLYAHAIGGERVDTASSESTLVTLATTP